MRISDWSSDVCSSDLCSCICLEKVKRTFSIQTPFRSAEPAHRRRPRSEYATCQIQHCHEPGEAVTFIRRKRRIVLKTAVDGSARADDARDIHDSHCRISHQITHQPHGYTPSNPAPTSRSGR